MAKNKQIYLFDNVNFEDSFERVTPYINRVPLLKWTSLGKGSNLWRFKKTPLRVKVFFTNRRGFGYSLPPYDDLNLGFHVGDDPKTVINNREMLGDCLGFDASRLTSPRQRHTNEVAILDRPEDVGTGAKSEESIFDPCDGLLTKLEHAPILLHFADCLPVVLVGKSETGPAIGVLHAGRQGLMAGVIENGVKKMVEALGVDPATINAALGPCIGACCYEIGEMNTYEPRQRFGDDVIAGTANLDLAAAAVVELKRNGVDAERIHILDICTSCDDNFYSYRRDGVTGRHGAIAWIE